MTFRTLIFALLIVLSAMPIAAPLQAQAVCGVADDIMYPVESIESRTIENGYDDFSLFRNRFGGNHVGLDVAFREQGTPIMAAARGRVTYSNIEGWDTEGGVVIVEHYFPDGSRYYSLYGHVEETDDITLPAVGDCVEMGDVIAAVGWPSQSAPHLHYEIRTFMPDDGGPGYVQDNPLVLGWLHPLDFTRLWQLRLQPGFLDYITFLQVPTLPPVALDNGTYAIASGEQIMVFARPNLLLWRLNMDDVISGMTALSGGRISARSRSGQTITVTSGRYDALWTVPGPDEPFVTLGDTLIFVTEGGGLAAYAPGGELLWSLPAVPQPVQRVEHFQAGQNTVSVALRVADAVIWRVTDGTGTLLLEQRLANAPVVTSYGAGGWMAVADGQLVRVVGGALMPLAAVNMVPGRTAQLAADLVGNTYLYTGDSTNTLLSLDTGGGLRWSTRVAADEMLLPPLLDVDNGCLLYTLDSRGQLRAFNTNTGEEVMQTGLYSGGDVSGRPAARLLQAEADGTVHVSAGFLTMVTFNGQEMAQEAVQSCLLG
ncbi:MAG: hypothetical protein OHK0046_45250 [Anaerolineae bacterium]